jgi:hypothetical protein
VIKVTFSGIWISAFAEMTVEGNNVGCIYGFATNNHDTKLPVVARNAVTKQSRTNSQISHRCTQITNSQRPNYNYHHEEREEHEELQMEQLD